jgi:rSAM/selenodomain-associated transferase 2
MISVIIPVLDEAPRLPSLLTALWDAGTRHEIIIVDGGSRDGSPEIASAHGATVLHSARGRGRQLAAGAAAARGDVLLFLHADSMLPAGGLQALAHTMHDAPALVGGNFRLIFDGDGAFSWCLTRFYAWLRRHGIYYGDSGIFVRRAVYDAVGGILPMALMEDFNLVRRLERAGRTACLEPPLVTSSRRFRGRHPITIVAGWLRIHLLYALGVSPERLAAMYDSARRR